MSGLLNPPLLAKSLARACFSFNEKAWSRIPAGIQSRRLVRAYGKWLHAIIRSRQSRRFYFGTHFLRNRPQLELMLRLLDRESKAASLSALVLACSIGAEVYSIAWTIRSRRPDRRIVINAIDISEDAVAFARDGVYPLGGSSFTDEDIFGRLTEQEMRELFHVDGKAMRVQDWIRKDIRWHAGDAADPGLAALLGPQDMVFANNFLCHMSPPEAEKCLRNIVSLVKPGGYLFVSGVDLPVRKRVAKDLNLEPVTKLIEEIHEGDPSLRKDWPFKYWGLEPLDKHKRDWTRRYASVFRVADCGPYLRN